MNRIIRGMTKNQEVRAFVAETKDLVNRVTSMHKTTPVASAALGRTLTAGAMMGAMLKGEKDDLTISIKGDGPIGGVMVTANGLGEVRGYVTDPLVDIPRKTNGKLDVSAAIGQGKLTVIRDFGMKEPYVGQIDLVSGEIADDLTYYFASSEQTNSVVALGVLVDKDYSIKQSGGFIIQLLPGATEETISTLEKNIRGLHSVTASERAMVRKMIVDSVVYWASEYHIDGFRFDLMGLHDIETMTAVRQALDEVDSSIIVFGEGWTGGACPLPENKRLVKENTFMVEGVGAFSDDLRDGIKGHVFENETPGFVNGHLEMEESVKFGVVGSTAHSQVEYDAVNYSDFPWANTPAESVNYAEAHDNLTLWDKIAITNPDDSIEDRTYMDKMSAAIFMTSQGVPFIHAGMEFLRTKDGDHNSYKSPDEVNMLNWQHKADHLDVFEYYKGLIQLRQAHPAFRMMDASMIDENLKFYGGDESYGHLQTDLDQMVAYIINNNANGDESGAILVAFNAASDEQELLIPEGNWTKVVNREIVDLNGIEIVNETLNLAPYESVVLLLDQPADLSKSLLRVSSENEEVDNIQEEEEEEEVEEQALNMDKDEPDEKAEPSNPALPIGIGLVALAGAIGAFVYSKKKSK